jgi:hypothetical protein
MEEDSRNTGREGRSGYPGRKAFVSPDDKETLWNQTTAESLQDLPLQAVIKIGKGKIPAKDKMVLTIRDF